MWELRLARSDRHPKLLQAFHRGQARMLGAIGALRVLTAPTPDADVYLVCALDERRRMRGAVRLHRCTAEAPPLAHALGHLPEICAAADDKGGSNLAEVRGLWVDLKVQGVGLGSALLRAAIASATLINVSRLVAFSHQHQERSFADVGLLLDPSLGEHPYPDDRYRSKVFWCDPVTQVGATSASRLEVLRMRDQLARTGSTSWDAPLARRTATEQPAAPSATVVDSP